MNFLIPVVERDLISLEKQIAILSFAHQLSCLALDGCGKEAVAKIREEVSCENRIDVKSARKIIEIQWLTTVSALDVETV